MSLEGLPLMLDAATVAELLHYSVQHVRRMCRAGQLPAVKMGREWLVPRRELERAMSAAFTGGPFRA